jgi:hypothetical protein
MPTIKHLQFSSLPYISIKEEIRIGEVILWSFYKNKDSYIKKETIKNQVEKFLKQYIHNSKDKEPIEGITMVSYGSPNNFKRLTRKQNLELIDSVTMLCFCSLIRNKSWDGVSSDDFYLVRQNFIPGNNGIAPTSGSIIQRMDSGWDIDDVLFITPFYINKGCGLNYHKDILSALIKLQQDNNQQEVYLRILESIRWVNYSYTNVDNFNYASRIVMMSTAFEILLGGFHDRYEFIGKIKPLIYNSLDSTKRMCSSRTLVWKGKKQNVTLSLKEWWAYEFYDLRSRIVHGEKTKVKDFLNRYGKAYFLLAIKFFEECLKKTLVAQDCYNYNFSDRVLWMGIYDEIKNKRKR